jgi:hypothetical protein
MPIHFAFSINPKRLSFGRLFRSKKWVCVSSTTLKARIGQLCEKRHFPIGPTHGGTDVRSQIKSPTKSAGRTFVPDRFVRIPKSTL